MCAMKALMRICLVCVESFYSAEESNKLLSRLSVALNAHPIPCAGRYHIVSTCSEMLTPKHTSHLTSDVCKAWLAMRHPLDGALWNKFTTR